MRNTSRYAITVNNGDKPLIVWTRETGILDVAYELNKCPNSWKTDSGNAVYITSHEGRLRPFFSAGIVLFSWGKSDDMLVNIKHQMNTDANWTIVRVAGLGRAFKMDFEEVLVKAEVMYQVIQRACSKLDLSAESW